MKINFELDLTEIVDGDGEPIADAIKFYIKDEVRRQISKAVKAGVTPSLLDKVTHLTRQHQEKVIKALIEKMGA